MALNDDIVAAARGWLGTRFHHQGRLKKTAAHNGGVDCLGLLIGVAGELDLRLLDGSPAVALDSTDYTHTPDTEYLRRQLLRALEPIPGDGIIAPGDILLFRIDHFPQHLAIVSDMPSGLGIIHSYAPARQVVEHCFDDWWKSRVQSAFRYSHLS